MSKETVYVYNTEKTHDNNTQQYVVTIHYSAAGVAAYSSDGAVVFQATADGLEALGADVVASLKDPEKKGKKRENKTIQKPHREEQVHEKL